MHLRWTAAIGLTAAFVSLCSVAAQYTGALRGFEVALQATPCLRRSGDAPLPRYDATRSHQPLRFGHGRNRLVGPLQTVNSSLAGFSASVITITVVDRFASWYI
ncbi:hypothetical protein C8R44DRAFT_886712 [Mycena epipterygia]|nr:hypothetical protein C8R44DRAFT_886712 [Mycena epipterygia]